MKNIIDELYDLKESIACEIGEANKRIKQNGDVISTEDLEIIDKLTHSLKSLATVCAMMEAEENGYSGNYGYGRSYGDYSGQRGMYSGRDYREGRNGRNSRNRGYSRGMDAMDHLRQLLDEAPDEMTRVEIRNLMDKMGNR